MSFYVAFYIITSFAFPIIPTIIIFIKARNLLKVFLLFLANGTYYALPFIFWLYLGRIEFDKISLIILGSTEILLILSTGLIAGLLYFRVIKKDLKNGDYKSIPPFIVSLGINAGYAFYYYFFLGLTIGSLKTLLNDEHGNIEEDDIPFKITLYKYPLLCYFIDFILYLGNFFNILAEIIIYKNDLNICYIILLIIFQSVLYPLHMVYVSYYSIALILVVIISSIIEILFGIFIYRKYGNNEKEDTLISEVKEGDNIKLMVTS